MDIILDNLKNYNYINENDINNENISEDLLKNIENYNDILNTDNFKDLMFNITKEQTIKLNNIINENENLKIINVFTFDKNLKKKHIDKFVNHYTDFNFDIIRFNNINNIDDYDILNSYENTIINIDIKYNFIEWILNINLYEYLYLDDIELFNDENIDLYIFPLYKLKKNKDIEIVKYNNIENNYSIRTLFKIDVNDIFYYNINSVTYKKEKNIFFNNKILKLIPNLIPFLYKNIHNNLNNYIINNYLNYNNFNKKLINSYDMNEESILLQLNHSLIDKYNNKLNIYLNSINDIFLNKFNISTYEKKLDYNLYNFEKFINKYDLNKYSFKKINIKNPVLNNYQLHSFNNELLLKNINISEKFMKNIDKVLQIYNLKNNTIININNINLKDISMFDIYNNKILTNLYLFFYEINIPIMYDIKYINLNNSYIIKPISGICSKGIEVLNKENYNKYKNIKSNKYIVEELLTQHDTGLNFLIDYKFFIFNGIPLIGFICKRSNSYPLTLNDETDTCWFVVDENKNIEIISIDKKGNLLNDNWIIKEINTIKIYINEIFNTCNKLNKIININISRIDFYITTKGLIVGELTWRSGNLYLGWNIIYKGIKMNILKLFNNFYEKYNINIYDILSIN